MICTGAAQDKCENRPFCDSCAVVNTYLDKLGRAIYQGDDCYDLA